MSSVSGSNGKATFTITRSNGTDKYQVVYYRTVNGSAVGGTHFTHEVGAVYFAEGKTETAMEHKPDYLRKSQAEREREEREAKNA